jgi:hypothetical protein
MLRGGLINILYFLCIWFRDLPSQSQLHSINALFNVAAQEHLRKVVCRILSHDVCGDANSTRYIAYRLDLGKTNTAEGVRNWRCCQTAVIVKLVAHCMLLMSFGKSISCYCCSFTHYQNRLPAFGKIGWPSARRRIAYDDTVQAIQPPFQLILDTALSNNTQRLRT